MAPRKTVPREWPAAKTEPRDPKKLKPDPRDGPTFRDVAAERLGLGDTERELREVEADVPVRRGEGE